MGCQGYFLKIALGTMFKINHIELKSVLFLLKTKTFVLNETSNIF